MDERRLNARRGDRLQERVDGGRQQFSRSIISFKPRVGDFYIFPGWLLHGAEPFRGKGERRSLAFNAFVSGGF